MKKILVIQTRVGIGDMCVFLPCIHEIKKQHQDYKLYLLTQKRSCSKEFLKHDKSIDKILYIPKKNIFLLNIWLLNFFLKNKFKKCFIFHYGFRYFFLALISQIKLIYFYGFTKKNENIVDKSRSCIKKWLRKSNLKFKCKIPYRKNYSLKNKILIGIGGSGHKKKWSIENYIKVIELINNKRKFNYVLAGGKEEIKDAKKIQKILFKKKIKVESLCKKKISDTLDTLNRSLLYIGNDTGFMHLAASMDVKSYGLFGTTPVNYASYNKKIITITPRSKIKKEINYNSNMMNYITPYDVFRLIKKEFFLLSG